MKNLARLSGALEMMAVDGMNNWNEVYTNELILIAFTADQKWNIQMSI